MRIGWVSGAILLLTLLIVVYTYMYVGVNISAVTLPWLALMTVATIIGVIFGVYGDKLIPLLLSKLGVKYYIGDGYIVDKYFIVTNFDSSEPYTYAGFAVAKLIPLMPTQELKDETKKQLLKTIESAIRSLPTDVEFCVLKSESQEIEKIRMKIEAEIKKIESKMTIHKNNPGMIESLRLRRDMLKRELDRIMASHPVMGIIYIKVYARGNSEREVREKLDQMLEVIKAQALLMNANVKILKASELKELIEHELLGHVVRRTL